MRGSRGRAGVVRKGEEDCWTRGDERVQGVVRRGVNVGQEGMRESRERAGVVRRARERKVGLEGQGNGWDCKEG